MNKLGRKIYKTSMIPMLRWGLTLLVILFYRDLYLETISDVRFIGQYEPTMKNVFWFLYKYPYEFLLLTLLILPPYFYYCFIRGIIFYENGLKVNRGLPFYHYKVFYNEINKFKVFHPQYMMFIHLKNGESFTIMNNGLDRILPIFDQQKIVGEFYHQELEPFIKVSKKIFYFILLLVIFLFFTKKTNWF